jgi:hypothetical protein
MFIASVRSVALWPVESPGMVLQNPPPVGLHQLAAGQFHRGLMPQEIQQHGHALFGGQNPLHHGMQAMERAAHDFHRFPRIELVGNDMQFLVSHGGAQVRDDGSRDRRPAVAEMHDALDAPCVLDLPKKGAQIKPREEVIREERFRDPGRTLPRWPVETDSGQEHLEAQIPPQKGCGDMLVLRLGPHAKPGGRINRRFGWMQIVHRGGR